MSKRTNANPGALAGASGAECKAEQLPSKHSTEAPLRKAYRAQAEWRERNQLKVWSHKAVQSALRRGIIEKQPCQVCGAEESEAHHEDHRNALDVRWLCRKHHKAVHAADRRAEHGGEKA